MLKTIDGKLTPQKWEEFVRQKGMIPIRKINSNEGVIYIAEGKRLPDLTSQLPAKRTLHYDVCGMFWRGGADFFSMRVMERQKFPTQKARIQAMVSDLDQMVAANQEVGRYK